MTDAPDGPTDLNHINAVLRFKTAVENIVADVLNRLRPNPRYATVASVDALNGIVNVIFPGDIDTTPVGISNSVAPSLMNPDFEFANSIVVVGGAQGNLHVIEVVNNWPYIRQPVLEEPFVSGYPRQLTIAQNETHGAAYFQAISSALPAVGDAWFMGAWMGLTANMGMVELVVDQDQAGGQTKKYTFGLTNVSAQNTDWQHLVPMYESGNQLGSDFDVEIKCSASAYATYASLQKRYNLCSNPAAAQSSAGWVKQGPQLPGISQYNDTPGFSVSTKCFRVLWNATTTGSNFNGVYCAMSCVIGQVYTASAYVKIPVGSVAVAIGVGGVGIGPSSASNNVWERIVYTFTATSNTHFVSLWANAAQTNGTVFFFGDVLFEKAVTALPYFDGDSPAGVWNGFPGVSTSTSTFDPGTGLNSSNTANGFALRVRRTSVGFYDAAIGTSYYRLQLWVYGERPYPSMWGSDSPNPSDVDVTSFGNLATWINGGVNHPVSLYALPTKTFGVLTTPGTDGLGMPAASGVQPQDFGGSLISPYNSSVMRANQLMSGGGATSWDGSKFYWTQRYIVMGLGKNSLIPSGYWNIGPCVGGFQVPIYTLSTGPDHATTVAGGVPLNQWQALYYELPLYGGGTFNENNFRIVDYNAPSTKVPAHWVLIAVYNVDSQSAQIYTGTGERIDLPNPMSLGTNIVNWGSPYGVPTYQKIDGQMVHLQGVLKANAAIGANAVIATVPAGYRPGTQEIFACVTSGNVTTRIDLFTNGQIQTVSAIASGSYVSLSNINYIAAQ